MRSTVSCLAGSSITPPDARCREHRTGSSPRARRRNGENCAKMEAAAAQRDTTRRRRGGLCGIARFKAFNLRAFCLEKCGCAGSSIVVFLSFLGRAWRGLHFVAIPRTPIFLVWWVSELSEASTIHLALSLSVRRIFMCNCGSCSSALPPGYGTYVAREGRGAGWRTCFVLQRSIDYL